MPGMRLINLDDHAVVELWPSRRIRLTRGPDGGGDEILSLPRGQARLSHAKASSQVFFGTASQLTIQLAGPRAKIEALWAGILAVERPDKVVRVKG